MSFSRNLSLIKVLLICLVLGVYSNSSAVVTLASSDVKSIKKLIIYRKNKNELARIGQFSNLEELTIGCLNELDRIPDDIGKLKNLKVLKMDCGNGGIMNPQLPESLGKLLELKELILYGAQDTSGGFSVGGSSESPSSKVRRMLPKSLINLKKLEKLNLGRNRYGSIPQVVFSMTSVKELDISYNDLTDLPKDLLNLPYLSKIILNGNYKITCSAVKQAELTKRFIGIYLDFENEYPCPIHSESQRTLSSKKNISETNSENPIENKYFQQALEKSNKGDYNGAIADYDKVIALYPDSSDAYYNQGLDYFKSGSYEKAIESLNKSLVISPDDSMALSYRGLVYSALKNYQEAINDFNRVIAVSPGDASAYFNRGVARSKLGDAKGAVNDYDYAIRFDSNFADAYINRGINRADLGDNQKAIQDFEQAIRLNPDFANSYVYRGMARSKLGDKKGALSDLQYAAELFKVQGRSAQYQTVIELLQKLGG